MTLAVPSTSAQEHDDVTGEALQTALSAVDLLLSTPAGRRCLSRQSPVFWDSYYCGMRYARHRESWLDTLWQMRRDAKRTGQKAKLLLLAPRDHGKTEAFISFAAGCIAEDRNVRILWVSETVGVGKKRLARVKALLETERFREDFCSAPDEGYGPLSTGAEKVTETMIYVARDKVSVDPTIEVVGIGGAVTGGHFDIILFDDVETSKTCYTAAQRAKTRGWYTETVLPMLSSGGFLGIIGTRKHHDDLYAHRIEDTTFDVIEDKAILQWPQAQVLDDVTGMPTGAVTQGWEYDYVRDKRGRRKCGGVRVLGPSQVLWPEERSIEYLLMEREGSTPTAFGREFQHEVVDDSTAPIKLRDIERARDRGAHLELLSGGNSQDRRAAWAVWQAHGIKLVDVVQCWDLALTMDAKQAETADTDYTVGLTIGKDLDGNRYLLGIARFRGVLPSQLRDKVRGEYLKFIALGIRPRVVAVEKNAFGSIHFLGLQRTTDLPLRPHMTTGTGKADPWDGVPAIGALFENGKVVLPCMTDEDKAGIQPLCDELHGLGREAHDDTAIALWIGELQLREDPFNHAMAFGDGEIVASNPGGDVIVTQTDNAREGLRLPGERPHGAPEPASLTEADVAEDLWSSLRL